LDGLDPGTIYEVGYAHSRGTKVIAFVSAERPEDLKMIIGGGSQITNDFATALYSTVWAATCK
jgi:nucleoside 2-deoxyribosyltransferase